MNDVIIEVFKIVRLKYYKVKYSAISTTKTNQISTSSITLKFFKHLKDIDEILNAYTLELYISFCDRICHTLKNIRRRYLHL